jgi:hypothetical protein
MTSKVITSAEEAGGSKKFIKKNIFLYFCRTRADLRLIFAENTKKVKKKLTLR